MDEARVAPWVAGQRWSGITG